MSSPSSSKSAKSKAPAAAKIAAPKPKTIDVTGLKSIYMTPADWIKIAPNPIQKPNRASRRRNDHLRTFNETHARVYMAQYPNGRRCKLDGHGRSYVWANGLSDFIPRRIQVFIVPVKNDAEAEKYFRYFDSREAGKNASDNVHGALKHHSIPTNSSLFQSSSGIATPLGYAFEIFNAATSDTTHIATSKANVYDHVAAFREQLAALDELADRCGTVKPPMIGAFVLAHMKYGDKITPFFERVIKKMGVKIGKKMDPVFAVEKLLAERRGKAREEHLECVAQILGALDTYMLGNFTESDYEPKVQMQRIMSVDLRQYLTAMKSKRTGAGRGKARFTR
ncbi:MAG: hypothetical protein EB060_11425 [Proteobacteria bacterium]|nr:hypothetical protein [Pseudomonadota bacterium]